ncbi:sugar ABC transporter ATP-binding protein [Rhodococcus sp. NPDC057529]|uniref:sugar ABC transporter ATP-binding protein n=1 Tax=Rhodococcus sp. NPDC057529 TaxID=3346158 RepID=UPI00366D7551
MSAAVSTDYAIEATNITKTFGSTRALRGASLQVRRGECHALLGRNGAGKSTLIAVLTGLVHADTGTLTFGGLQNETAGDAVACVYQKSTLVPDLTVAENITMGAQPKTHLGFVDWKTINTVARDLLRRWGNPQLAEKLVCDLEPIEKKIVEICRALSRGPRILLLDEPTAGLDGAGATELFRQIETLKSDGVTVLYVSHHLEEIFAICDSVTVLRDGTDVMSCPMSDLTMNSLIASMTGSTGDDAAAPSKDRARANGHTTGSKSGAALLEIEDLHIDNRVHGFDLSVRPGECVGLTGLDGAGHVHIGRAIAGHIRPDRGRILQRGKALKSVPAQAIDAGIGFVPEDRHIDGYVPELSVEENATLTILHRIKKRTGFVDTDKRRGIYRKLSDEWTIVASSPSQPAEQLSGGNQQKVVLARALASEPHTLVIINPTAGVDVAAKQSIYDTLTELTREGKALIVVSGDDDDLDICDRVFALRKGRVVREFIGGFSEDDLVAAVQGADAPSLTNEFSSPDETRSSS